MLQLSELLPQALRAIARQESSLPRLSAGNSDAPIYVAAALFVVSVLARLWLISVGQTALGQTGSASHLHIDSQAHVRLQRPDCSKLPAAFHLLAGSLPSAGVAGGQTWGR